MEGEPARRLFVTASEVCLLQVIEVSCCLVKVTHDQMVNYPELESLNQKYANIFEDLVELPPSRGVFNHRVPVEEGKDPVNIRPDRYRLKQTNVIE